jgi:hypothetical protein
MARLADIQAARLAGALLTGDAVNGDAVKRDAPFTLISRRKVRFWIGASATLAAIILVSWKVESHDPQSSGLSLGEQSSIQEKDMKFTQAMSVAVAASSICSGVTAQSTAVQWTVASGGNGHWYELVISRSITWPSAKDACEQRGGHLVTPTTPTENALVTQLGNRADHPTAWVDDFGGNAQGPWLGGYQPIDAQIAQPWAWVTGEPWTWAGWAPGEPNGGYGPGVTFTGMLGYANSNYYRGWFDGVTTDYSTYPLPLSYIIEWSADCNSDGIVDYGQILSGELIDTNSNGIPDICEIDPCLGDINLNSIVDAVDLAMVLTSWGTSGSEYPRADVNHDGVVNGPDLGALLGGWGFCP